MASEPERMRTSAEIAAHAGTNAVVVRRVLGILRNAGLLISEKGHTGGWRLAQAPAQISLADVYLALNDPLVANRGMDMAPGCSIEHRVQTRVAHILAEVEEALIQKLAETSIASIHEDATSSKPIANALARRR